MNCRLCSTEKEVSLTVLHKAEDAIPLCPLCRAHVVRQIDEGLWRPDLTSLVTEVRGPEARADFGRPTPMRVDVLVNTRLKRRESK